LPAAPAAAAFSWDSRTSICEFTLAVVESMGIDTTVSIISLMPGREAFSETVLAASARALMTRTASFLIFPVLSASRMVVAGTRPASRGAMIGAA